MNPISDRIDTLTSLKNVAADFAHREKALERKLKNQRYAAGRDFREGMERAEARFGEQLAAVETAANAEVQRQRTRHFKRREWIQKARDSSARTVMRRAQQVREKWLGELQLRHRKLDRALPADLKHADAEYTKEGESIQQLQAEIVTLEHLAQHTFSGYTDILKSLRVLKPDLGSLAEEKDPAQLRCALVEQISRAENALTAFKSGAFLPRFLSRMPLSVPLLIALVAAVITTFLVGLNPMGFAAGGGAFATVFALGWALYRVGQNKARPTEETILAALSKAGALGEHTQILARTAYENERKRIQDAYDTECAELSTQWERADEIEREYKVQAEQKILHQTPRVTSRHEALLAPRLQAIQSQAKERSARIHAAAAQERERLTAIQSEQLAAADLEGESLWRELEADWTATALPLREALAAEESAGDHSAPDWTATAEHWAPATAFATTLKFAELQIDLASLPGGTPTDPRLALPGLTRISVPVSLSFPRLGSVLFETSGAANAEIVDAMNGIILRLLTSMPPGKIAFTLIDPMGLGQSFAGLMHLADYSETLIDRRIWTQRDEIDDRLLALSDHIEKMIQMYLRSEFATITEYNEQAGSVAEKYHFLVIADFPANFSETAARRLQSIASAGARCGVFLIMHWDRRHPLPEGIAIEDLRKHSISVRQETEGFTIHSSQAAAGAALVFDPPPTPEVSSYLIHKIGKASVDANQVEVPFSHIAPKPVDLWKSSTTDELRIPIGRTGATKLQLLAIGKGTRQHALLAGKTGSGKSTLLHVIITNLALACSPEEVEFYLIDFKKGVEFKCYATHRLPHARVIAIESDREFGLSVLQRVDEELRRRGDLFRALGVQDVPGYKREQGTEPMPRLLLIIDEFQEFFVEDDAIAQSASILFDRIVRQGRAFGIHVILGSQTLGGAYTLARTTLGQMAIRIALQCNEADAYLIMDDNNAAPRLLSRPGEGIYNDASGAVEGNTPFQVVWLPDQERDRWLDTVAELAAARGTTVQSPVVFEGNAPADIRENRLLESALLSVPSVSPSAPKCWFGAPNAIKGPTECTFQRQSGSHLLIIGQREEATLSLLGSAIISLAAQHRTGDSRFLFLHSAADDSPSQAFVAALSAAVPGGVEIIHGHNLSSGMQSLSEELKTRLARNGEPIPGEPRIFCCIHGLHRFKKLRKEDDFSFSSGSSEEASPGDQFAELIAEGSSNGIHLLLSVDTFNNTNRFLSRKALTEFEMRIVFQMSANDSASLIDSPRASTLGLHRALLYNEQEGSLETFRPYALPPLDWVRDAGAQLHRRDATAPDDGKGA